jgi:hypothetical protein
VEKNQTPQTMAKTISPQKQMSNNRSDHDNAPNKDKHGHEGEKNQNNAEELLNDSALEDNASVVKEPRTEAQARYNLRPNWAQDYSNRLSHAMDNPANTQSYEFQFLKYGDDNAPALWEAVKEMQRIGCDSNVLKRVTGTVMMQMTATGGIKKHGQVAIDAIFNEFSQLHDLTVLSGQDVKGLARAQKKAALRAINVIKEKRCGKIKGRTLANGRAQRSLYMKDKISSATVATSALILSIIIDAEERQDVATADVPPCEHKRLHAS